MKKEVSNQVHPALSTSTDRMTTAMQRCGVEILQEEQRGVSKADHFTPVGKLSGWRRRRLTPFPWKEKQSKTRACQSLLNA